MRSEWARAGASYHFDWFALVRGSVFSEGSLEGDFAVVSAECGVQSMGRLRFRTDDPPVRGGAGVAQYTTERTNNKS